MLLGLSFSVSPISAFFVLDSFSGRSSFLVVEDGHVQLQRLHPPSVGRDFLFQQFQARVSLASTGALCFSADGLSLWDYVCPSH